MFITSCTAPKVTMKEAGGMSDPRARPNSVSASAGTTVRVMLMTKPTRITWISRCATGPGSRGYQFAGWWFSFGGILRAPRIERVTEGRSAQRLDQHPVKPKLASRAELLDPDGHALVPGFRLRPVGA